MHKILQERPWLQKLVANGKSQDIDRVTCQVELLDERTLLESPLRFSSNPEMGYENQRKFFYLFSKDGGLLARINPCYVSAPLRCIAHSDQDYEGHTASETLLQVEDPAVIHEAVTITQHWGDDAPPENVVVHTIRTEWLLEWINKRQTQANRSIASCIASLNIGNPPNHQKDVIDYRDGYMIKALCEALPIDIMGMLGITSLKAISLQRADLNTCGLIRHQLHGSNPASTTRFYDREGVEILRFEPSSDFKANGPTESVDQILRDSPKDIERAQFVVHRRIVAEQSTPSTMVHPSQMKNYFYIHIIPDGFNVLSWLSPYITGPTDDDEETEG